MKTDKTRNDVLGVKLNCMNYIECPVCYGCRNYNSSDMNCDKCAQDPKNNICNISKHQTEPIARLITRTTINI